MHHHQLTRLVSVFGPQKEHPAGESRFCTVYSRKNWNFCWFKAKTHFVWTCWTIHISTKNLNWFFRLLKNINPSTKLQMKPICLFFKGNIVHLTRRRALRALMVASFKRLQSLFLCRQSLSEHVVFGQNTFLIGLVKILSYRQPGVNALHIVIALIYFTFVCHLISVPVEVLNFAMVKFENFRKIKLIAA